MPRGICSLPRHLLRYFEMASENRDLWQQICIP